MVTFHTNHGDIVIKTFDDKAPETVKNFGLLPRRFLQQHYFPPCDQRLYDPGRRFRAACARKRRKKRSKRSEQRPENTRGTLAMARTQAPHSATAQFFINVADNDFLNFSGESLQGWGYCVFAEVVEGMDVVDKIKAVSTGRSGMHQTFLKKTL